MTYTTTDIRLTIFVSLVFTTKQMQNLTVLVMVISGYK